MAGIDKTYTYSWKDYVALKEWMKTQPNRCELLDCLYEWVSEDFNGVLEVPVMNTTTHIDRYLIMHCPLEFVQNRMREVYPPKYYARVKKRGE